MDSEEGRGRSRERSGRTRRRRGSAERYGNGSGTGLGPARRRAEVANMIERARARIDKAVAETNPQQGGRRARRARTRKAVKKSLHGLPKNVKFMGFFTRKQAEKMLRRRH